MRKLIDVLLIALCSPAALAVPMQIDSFDQGWYRNPPTFNPPSNTNTFTGFDPAAGDYRSFYVFDLSSLAGMNITSMSVRFRGNNGFNNGTDLSKDLGLFDYTGSITSLIDGTGGISAYNDLGTGTSYGTAVVTKGPTFSVPMPEINVALTTGAIVDANEVLGSLDTRFVVGASLTETYASLNVLWSSSSGIPAASLFIETGPVPEPSIFGLIVLGLVGIGFAREKCMLTGTTR